MVNFFNKLFKKKPKYSKPCRNVKFIVGISRINLEVIYDYFPDKRLLAAVEALIQFEKEMADDDSNQRK